MKEIKRKRWQLRIVCWILREHKWVRLYNNHHNRTGKKICTRCGLIKRVEL